VISRRLLERLHRESGAQRWQVSVERFGAALEASAKKASLETTPEVDKYLSGLHLADLALACACADGHEGAWEHFIREQRPVLYRSADAIDPSGGARDLADAIYADLYGMPKGAVERQSLFRYFHGRSSLSTWLRAVLAQRHVDRVRSARKLDELPGDESPKAIAAAPAPDPARDRLTAMVHAALARAVAALAPGDRLRLGCYYAQEMTLAQIGKLTGEHEATISRQLARTRNAIKAAVEDELGRTGLDASAIADAFQAAARDSGALDLRKLIGEAEPRKEFAFDRSREGKSL
jgi:RNA polymerase sigma factor (sigma-70 family)